MVNESRPDSKSQLLSILRNSSAPISGDNLGGQIGISRVAVYKHLKALKNRGYPVIAGRHGYSLGHEVPGPFSTWEFGPEEKVTVLSNTNSTMDEARRTADRHPGEDFILVSERQSAGRGRRNRSWDSPSGGLWTTRVIHPGGSALRIQLFVLAASAALARMLRDQRGINAVVKWPNDILIEGKKVAGVLGEALITGDRISWLSLGLGLNVNNRVNPGATALKDISGREEDRRDLLRSWVEALDKLCVSDEFSAGGSPAWWNPLMTGIGTEARYIVGGRMVTGVVAGVDGLGRLRLRQKASGGSDLRLSPGDIDDPPPVPAQ